MSPSAPPAVPPTPHRVMRIILLAGLIATVSVLGINTYDSGIFKAPLFVTTSLLLIGTFLAGGLTRGTVLFSRSPGDLPVAGLAVLSLAGLLIAPVPHLARQAVLHVLSCSVFFFAGTQLFGSRPHVRTLVLCIGWLAAATAAFGLVQYFLADKLALEFYLGSDRRIGSLLGSPAFLGGFIVLVAPLVLSTALAQDVPRGTRRFMGAVFAALTLSLFLTRSRSSIIAGVLSLALFSVLHAGADRRRLLLRGYLLLAAGAVVLAMVLPPARAWIVHALDAGSGSTLARRWFFWEAGVRAFMASPVWGHGTGSFEPVMIFFRSPGYWIAKSEDVVPHAHNEIIETAVELGIIGLVLAGWFLWSVLRPGFRNAMAPDGWRRPLAIGLLCGMIGLAIDNLTNVSLRQAPVAATAWLFAGLLAALPSPVGSGPRPPSSSAVPRWLMAAGLALGLGFLIWYIPLQAHAVAADRHTITGLLQIGRGEDARAVNELRQAIDHNPLSALARSAIAGILLKTGHPAEALTEARALLAFYPDYPRAWLIVAVGLLGTHRVGEAGDAIRRGIAFRDHPEDFYVQAAICRTAADTAGERTALKMVLMRCLAGSITMHAAYAAGRLRELSTTRPQLEELGDLLDSLHAAFPEEETVRTNQQMVHTLLGRTPTGSSASP
jgi:O-antigen ligase